MTFNSITDEDICLVAVCSVCGGLVGGFSDKGAIMRQIAVNNSCSNCDTTFSIMPDGDFYNLKYHVVPSKEEYIVSLLEEMHDSAQQYIFGYEDKGPNFRGERYPVKRMRFFRHSNTERASPAFALMVHKKDTNILERSYCFDNPYALFQIAREAMKGYYWLRYDIVND